MEFVDNTGHIFSLKSYNEKPIGYEYNENPYIFWIDSNTSNLSINNYYARPIYCLYLMDKDYDINDLSNDDESPIEISIEIEKSNVFNLVSSKKINDCILSDNYNNLNDYIDLNFDNDNSYIYTSLSNKDLCVVKTTENINNNSGTIEFNYLLIPIYVLASAKEEGTWISNIMIHIYDKNIDKHDWCPISVGGEFVNEYEELIINGKNIGVNLPKDILKAVYSESLYNDEFNEALYNEKMKEYLINVSSIKNECGNFKSAINSLKWFGYGDKLTISKLLKTDNDLKNQYLLDYFNISYDINESFKTFISDSLVSIKLMIDKESSEVYPFNTQKDIFGENKPKIVSLLDSYEKIKIGNHDMPIENDDEKYWYWKPYFDFSFNELGIKLACLKQFYKKYFLPIHIYVHSIGLGSKVYSNDVKYSVTSGVSMSQPIVSINNKQCEVEFNSNNEYYFTKQIHYVDENFNEFTIADIEHDARDWYEINDTCVNIPIKFINNDQNKGYFNCTLILFNKNISNKILYESQFAFCQNDNIKYKNFIIYPKKFNVNINETGVHSNYLQYWINDDFELKLLVNNRWYEYNFKTKINNPIIDFGTLRYRYYYNDHNYLLSKINNTGIHSFVFTDKTLEDNIIIENPYLSFDTAMSTNNSLYVALGLLDENNNSTSFIKTLDISNIDDFWQYSESNYNILSPFTQLNKINDTDKRISFNAYMHTSKLVEVNNIDYDVDFYKILQYHLDHDLLYLDGTLLNDAFYQFIIYDEHEILIHKDLIGENIYIPSDYLSNSKTLVCAIKDNLYILSETGSNTDSYFINSFDSTIFMSENDYPLVFDSINLVYNKVLNAYQEFDQITGNIIGTYYIYNKLYKNLNYVYDNYKYEVNLPNLDKYKNSLHLFNIYETTNTETNILVFNNGLDVYVNDVHFTNNKYIKNIEDTYKIFVKGNSNEANTKYLDTYGLHLIEGSENIISKLPIENSNKLWEYGIYVKRDYAKYYSDNVNIYDLPNLFEFDTNEYTYYIDKTRNIPIGSLYFNTLEDFYSNNILKTELIDSFKDIKIFKEDNIYYFYDLNVKDIYNPNKNYKNKILFKIEFYNEDDGQNPINLTIDNYNKSNYAYVKIRLYYNKPYIVRNRFYLLIDYIKFANSDNSIYSFDFNNFNDDKIFIKKGGERVEVNLIKLNKQYTYTNPKYNYLIPNQNPSYYWYNLDNGELETLPAYLNELERYTYNAQDELLDDIIVQLDLYKEKFNSNNLDDKNEALYKYYNYLSKDLTGKKGKYKLSIESDPNSNIESNIIVEIFINNERIIYENNETFDLTGEEDKVTLYIQLNTNNYSNINTWILPKLYEINEVIQQLEYDPIKYHNETLKNKLISVKYLNNEYFYGDNDNENVYNLYSEFFKLKYNIYDVQVNDDRTTNCNLLNTIYEEVDSIKLNMYLDYDFYLMHDDKYWYGLYISKQTCDKVNRYTDLNVPEDKKKLYVKDSNGNNKYILSYKNSGKEYLLNRFEFVSSNGLNQFTKDSIICCYVYNNDRLPVNPYISSKWQINPLSLGMTKDSSFESNAEMTILSIPKNDNIYQTGYYKVTVKYSIDRDIQHQFKNTSTIKIY